MNKTPIKDQIVAFFKKIYRSVRSFFGKIKLSVLLENKRLLQVLSVLIAIVVWALVATGAGAIETRTIRGVPVEYDASGSLYENMMLRITDYDVETVDVTVTGAKYVIGSLTASDIVVNAVLKEVVGPAEYQLPLTASLRDSLSGVTVKIASTDTATATFDRFETRMFSVSPSALSVVTAAEGFHLGKVGISYNNVNVTGPVSLLDKIDNVVAYYTGRESLSVNTVFNGQIVLLDSNGDPIEDSNISMTRRSVDVEQPVLKLKELNVKVVILGAPDGFAEEFLTIRPSKVTVAIDQDLYDVYTLIPTTDAFYLRDFTKSFEDTVRLSPQDGVTLIDDDSDISVRFNYSNVSSKKFTVRNIQLEGLENAADYSFTAVRNIIENVTLYGKRATLNAIDESQLRAIATINAASLTTGELELEVKITVPEGVVAWTAETYTVTYNVSRRN